MASSDKLMVLDEFIMNRQKDFPYATGDLTSLLRDIGVAAKMVNKQVNKAGLADILGSAKKENIQGEEVKKLDEYANDMFIHALSSGGFCAGIASEENEDWVAMNNDYCQQGKYVITIDPLDGSSNIDVNVSIGTIFSIYRRESQSGSVGVDDFLQPGHKQVAAGYIVYGSSTMLVFTTGRGVNGFTLDPSIGEFCLSHPDIQIPENGSIYSINQGNFLQYEEGVQKYIRYCMGMEEGSEKALSLRYIGSMVADLHRNLIKGGIFIYPASKDAKHGKLRLLYECNPMAFIVEQAGGMATNGYDRILDLKPQSLHQRSPIFIGSPKMVRKAMDFLAVLQPLKVS